jgi:cell division inhibitor SepF
MAGMLRKSMLYLGLVDDEDEYPEHDDPNYRGDYSDRERYAEQPTQAETERHRGVRTLERNERVAPAATERAVPGPAMGGPSRITTLHPRTYNDARGIGEEFRRGAPVIMNLTDMEDADAKRLVDFAAGLTFGLRGRIEKVTRGVFLLSPQGVDVTLDADTGVVSGGFYNQS